MVVEIFVESPNQLADSPFNINITGLHPYQEAIVQMSSRDYYNINASITLPPDTLWQSQATFLTDAKGSISLNKTPAISGSYKGINEMGLFSISNQQVRKKDNCLKISKIFPYFLTFIYKFKYFKKRKY